MRLKDETITIPSEFLCPINYDIMQEPVMTADGHSYERKAIELWLQNNNTSPITNERLANKKLVTNWGLKKAIESFITDANLKYDRKIQQQGEQDFHSAVSESIATFKSEKKSTLESKLTFINKKLVDEPMSEKLINIKAMHLRDLKRYDEALQLLKTAIKTFPSNTFLLSTRASIYKRMGNHHAAKQDYEHINALKSGPVVRPSAPPAPQVHCDASQTARALADSAKVLRQEKKFAEALSLSSQALKFEPNNPFILNGYADSLCKLGNYREAIDAFAKVLAVKPRDVYALNGRGLAHQNLGEMDQARQCFAQVVSIQPHNKVALAGFQRSQSKQHHSGKQHGLFHSSSGLSTYRAPSHAPR